MESVFSLFGKLLALVFLIVACFAITVGVYWLTTVRSEVQLRSAIEAQQDTNRASFDTMWKILQDEAGVSNQYRETFQEVYPKLIGARYSERSHLLASFIKEANPTYDTKLSEKLMASIESERKHFLREQKKLRDFKREHDNLIKSPPSSLFVGSRGTIDVVLITSDEAEQAFESGRDNNHLFPKAGK